MTRIILNIIIFLFLTSSFSNYTFAQKENALPYVIKESVYDFAPQFPGGAKALNKYYADSIIYPQDEKERKIQGYVMTTFTVTKKGKIKNIHIVNGVPGGPNFVKETIRLLENMPKWLPATKKGKRVDAEINMSILFKLQQLKHN